MMNHMTKKSLLICSISAFLFVQCRTSKVVEVAEIKEQNCISCFQPELVNSKATCETSAIVFDGTKILIANDKDMPDGRTSVFAILSNTITTDTSKIVYLKNPIFKAAKKYEDFAITPNQSLIFLSTGFDRVKDNSAEWDGFNTILYWEKGQDESPKVLSEDGKATSSVALRKKISKVLANEKFPEGVPYFKIEGFAATNTHLYLGVREIGESFQNPIYVVKVIEVPYTFKSGVVSLSGAMKVVADFQPDKQVVGDVKLGLSSIEYDRFNKRFVILTSYETPENVGAYLWTASLNDLRSNKISIVKTSNGEPLKLNTKAEDVTIVDKSTVYIINDDDRLKTKVNGQTRQLNQAFYQVISLK